MISEFVCSITSESLCNLNCYQIMSITEAVVIWNPNIIPILVMTNSSFITVITMVLSRPMIASSENVMSKGNPIW